MGNECVIEDRISVWEDEEILEMVGGHGSTAMWLYFLPSLPRFLHSLPSHRACRILVPQPVIKTAPSVKGWSPNHWASGNSQCVWTFYH